ncbi:MAG: ParB/RepB/Spo0J family partition protein [Culturomica sp.]|jgi:ParB family chromosome partitioning protein|nr:ParB/RepB/Spo0J family partition protein [Culturomica sp.]
MAKKSALGKGLSALIEDADDVSPKEHKKSVAAIQELSLDKIVPNPYQPRTEFDEETLKELATSINSIGIVQPITVRETVNGRYEIIAGERRFRASKLAGLTTIPAYIRKTDDDNILEMALIENIQREDLNAIEVAISYQRLLDECDLTQDQLSERVGKKRATISNYLRLLKLPAQIQLAIRDKKISMGHARAIISVEEPDVQFMIFEQILKYDFSVRKVEEIVRELANPTPEEIEEVMSKEENKPKKKNDEIGDYIELQKHLSRRFNTKVELKRNAEGKGKIVIPFRSDAELETIIGLLDSIEE